MTENQKRFELYQTVLRFLGFKITENLRRIYLDIDLENHKMKLTACYTNMPSELEEELLDDIVTNSNAHIPDFFVESKAKQMKDVAKDETHDFIVFAMYEDYES